MHSKAVKGNTDPRLFGLCWENWCRAFGLRDFLFRKGGIRKRPTTWALLDFQVISNQAAVLLTFLSLISSSARKRTLFLVATVIGSGIMAERLAGGNVALALLAKAPTSTPP